MITSGVCSSHTHSNVPLGVQYLNKNLSQAVATNTFLAINDNNFLGFRDMRVVVVKILQFYPF